MWVIDVIRYDYARKKENVCIHLMKNIFNAKAVFLLKKRFSFYASFVSCDVSLIDNIFVYYTFITTMNSLKTLLVMPVTWHSKKLHRPMILYFCLFFVHVSTNTIFFWMCLSQHIFYKNLPSIKCFLVFFFCLIQYGRVHSNLARPRYLAFKKFILIPFYSSIFVCSYTYLCGFVFLI